MYVASALMLNSVFGEEKLPVGQTEHERRAPAIVLGLGEPGVKHGQ